MQISKFKYFAAYLSPLVVFISLYLGGYFSYFALIFLFGFLPFLELFLNPTKENFSEAEEEIVKYDQWYDFVIYSMLPIQYALLGYFLYQIGDSSLMVYEKVGMTLAYGMAAGVLGINVAHELGHRNSKYEQFMSKLLLLTSLYMHFFIEHNRGHHKHVSTDNDPASSRWGEWVYFFWFRSSIGGWLSAWQLEADRLKRQQKAVLSIHNEMIIYQLIQAALLLLIFFSLGGVVVLCFIGGATVGFLLLETVNYIEHYGLRRKKKGSYYERTLPIHSWNSNHPIGRLLLFELSRHSDHHFIANRKYQTLRHFDESPQMPTGYPGMMLLSLIPPLWFWVMHQKIEKYKTSQMGVALG